MSARRSAHESTLPGVVSGVFRQFQTCAWLNNLQRNRLMTGSDHVETKRPGWLLIRDRACLFSSHSLLLCVFVCVAVDLAMLWVWEGNMFVLVSQYCSQQHRLQFTLLYMEWMNPSQDICRKLILSSIHHLGLVCDSSFTVYTRKLWALHILSSQDISLGNAYGPVIECCAFLFWWCSCLWHLCYWVTSSNIQYLVKVLLIVRAHYCILFYKR